MPSKATKKKKTGLGRGLGSLLGGEPTEVTTSPVSTHMPASAPVAKVTVKGAEEEEAARVKINIPKIPDEARIWSVPIDKIMAQKNQPRKVFEANTLEELSQSIKEKGILQPIVARKLAEDKFEIIAGERRWRAAQVAGLHRVPVILKKTDEQNALELALIENIQRQDLNPMEEAEAFDYLMTTYNMTQKQVADKVGKERATVANILRLLKLNPKVREMVASQEISLGQAKVLLVIEDSNIQHKLAKKVIKSSLSVRATEKLVNRFKNPGLTTHIDEPDDKLKAAKRIEESLQKIIGTKVAIDYSKGKGKLSIHYYSDSQLNEISTQLKGLWSK